MTKVFSFTIEGLLKARGDVLARMIKALIQLFLLNLKEEIVTTAEGAPPLMPLVIDAWFFSSLKRWVLFRNF